MACTFPPRATRPARKGPLPIGATLAAVASLAVGVLVAAAPAAAQSREQRQLMADVRMLQEQAQILQNMLGTIAEAIKAVNGRIDEQAGVSSRAMADQKLVIDTLTSSVREIREKLDDNTVRLGSLTQEVEALRQGVQLLSAPPPIAVPPDPNAPAADTPTAPPGVAPEPDSAVAGAVPPVLPPPAAPPTPPLGTSPQKLYDEAWSDYALGQWDLAISGFQAVIQYFPRSERAADAQLLIGNAHLEAGNNEAALAAYEATIAGYAAAPVVPEAHYKKGLALRNLKRVDEARGAFELVVKSYPDSNAAILAKQGLAQLARQN